MGGVWLILSIRDANFLKLCRPCYVQGRDSRSFLWITNTLSSCGCLVTRVIDDQRSSSSENLKNRRRCGHRTRNDYRGASRNGCLTESISFLGKCSRPPGPARSKFTSIPWPLSSGTVGRTSGTIYNLFLWPTNQAPGIEGMNRSGSFSFNSRSG